jgi:hypothetical protein
MKPELESVLHSFSENKSILAKTSISILAAVFANLEVVTAWAQAISAVIGVVVGLLTAYKILIELYNPKAKK